MKKTSLIKIIGISLMFTVGCFVMGCTPETPETPEVPNKQEEQKKEENQKNDKQEQEENQYKVPEFLIGKWVSDYGEVNVITETTYTNTVDWSAWGYPIYTLVLSDLAAVKVTDTTGFVYGKYTDLEKVGAGGGAGPDGEIKVGSWQAAFYYEYDSVKKELKQYQPYKDIKANEETGTPADLGKKTVDSLEEAIKEYTIENKYYDFSNPSVCSKEE